eukprot:6192851-Pleurochrysis_carterae.AAC.2
MERTERTDLRGPDERNRRLQEARCPVLRLGISILNLTSTKTRACAMNVSHGHVEGTDVRTAEGWCDEGVLGAMTLRPRHLTQPPRREACVSPTSNPSEQRRSRQRIGGDSRDI